MTRQRIRLPMHLLGEPVPTFEPGDVDLPRKLSLIDRRVPFELLYQTLTRLGYEVGDFPPDECYRYIAWTAKHLPEAARDRSVVLEMGWLPRSAYQISSTGSNAKGHYASAYQFRPLSQADEIATTRYLAALRRAYERGVSPAAVAALRRRLHEPFYMFAFQLANDNNLRHSNTTFAQYCSTTPDRNMEFAQACVNAVDRCPSPLPVVYKQHPFDPTQGFAEGLHTRGVVLGNETAVSTHEIFATGLCRGVVSINSNTIHDACVWGVPSLCLGTLIWSPHTNRPPFPRMLDGLATLREQRPLAAPETLSYLHYLICHQWNLTDFQNDLMVTAMLDQRGECEPASLRRECGYS